VTPLASAPPYVSLAGLPLTLSGCGVDHVKPSSTLRVPHCTQPPQPWLPNTNFVCTYVIAPETGSTTGAPPYSVALLGSLSSGTASDHVAPSSTLRRR